MGSRLGDSARVTLQRFRAGQSEEQIAGERGLVTGTIYGHLAEAIACGEQIELARLLTPEQQAEIAAGFAKAGFGNLGAVFQALGGVYEYGLLRVYRASADAVRRSGP